MTTASQTKIAGPRLRFHPNAYKFVFAALQHTQQKLGRRTPPTDEEAEAHISGQELLEGIRELAVQQFGLLTKTVFHAWGVRSTGDFGRIVFELVERGEMRKTDRDHPADFFDVYDFDDAFDRRYPLDFRNAFGQ